jgi:outer membrane biosynthesis protein TonB
VRRLAAVVLLFLLCVPGAGAWTWPVAGPVLSPFSFDPAHPYAGGQHRGVDVGGSAGDAVAAPAAGVVTFAGSVPSSGSTVSILTADALSVTLTHLGSVAVAKGATGAEGATIGTVGPSGAPEVSGPYVHLGVRTAADDNGYLDPLSFLPPPAPPAPAPAPAAVEPPPAAPEPVAPPPAPEPAAPKAEKAEKKEVSATRRKSPSSSSSKRREPAPAAPEAPRRAFNPNGAPIID